MKKNSSHQILKLLATILSTDKKAICSVQTEFIGVIQDIMIGRKERWGWSRAILFPSILFFLPTIIPSPELANSVCTSHYCYEKATFFHKLKHLKILYGFCVKPFFHLLKIKVFLSLTPIFNCSLVWLSLVFHTHIWLFGILGLPLLLIHYMMNIY